MKTRKVSKKLLKASSRIHLYKAITWRVLASMTTFLLALFFFADDPNGTEKATGIAIAEAIIKMLLYYLHERIWFRVSFNLDIEEKNEL